MLSKIVLILISGAVGFFFGLLSRAFWERKSKEEKDRNTLILALEQISELTLPARRSPLNIMASEGFDKGMDHIHTRQERKDVCKKKLHVLSFKLQMNENEEIARKIREFASGAGNQRIGDLKREIEAKLNEKNRRPQSKRS